MPLPVMSPAPMTPMTIDGDVVAAYSYWTEDGARIVTDATVRGPDGSEVVVSQLGGSVDGIGMITMPGPPILAAGMTVSVAAHHDVDLAQRDHVVLDSVAVTEPRFAPDYVRTGPTKAGHYLYWEPASVSMTLDSAGTTAIAGDGEFPIIDASIATWNTDTASCSYFKVVDGGRRSLEVGNDGVNLIKFRDTFWGVPATGNTPAVPHNASAAGITTATFIDDGNSSRDGAIVDADVELNGVDYAISVNNVTESNAGCHAELQNTLTHEIGHVHGLEHTCRVPGDPPRVDNLGHAVPMCMLGSDPPAIADPTMYNFQNCGETKKETLEPDDIQAICDIYPTSKAPSGGCCSASRQGERPLASLIGAGLVLTLLRRRKFR